MAEILKVHIITTSEKRFHLFKSLLGIANTQTWEDVQEDLKRIKDLNAQINPNDPIDAFEKSSIMAHEILSRGPAVLIIDFNLGLKYTDGYDIVRFLNFKIKQKKLTDEYLGVPIPAIHVFDRTEIREKRCLLGEHTDHIRLGKKDSLFKVWGVLQPKMIRLIDGVEKEYESLDCLKSKRSRL